MLAFERHATSKLSSDVKRPAQSIATLGFRGEALPSIAAVSRLLLETRSAEEATGIAVEIAGGKLLRADETALAQGTTITVRDLFYNVPARRKFLRTEQTELAHIASLVTHYSLAHPGKTFELYSGAAELLRVTPVDTLRERVYQVFGDQVLEELVEIPGAARQLPLAPAAPATGTGAPDNYREGPQAPEIRVFGLRGFVSRPQVHRPNRNSIFIFINGRLIRDRLLLHALSAAYYNLMPSGVFPFALLFLECGAEEVDVNVHPSKTEVRFVHAPFVHDFLRDSIRETLMESRPAPPFRMSSPVQAAARLPYSEFSQAIDNQWPPEGASGAPEPAATATQAGAADGGPIPPRAIEERVEDLPSFALRPAPAPAPRFDFAGEPILLTPRPAAGPAVPLRVPDTHGPFPAGLLPEPESSLSALPDLRPLGQIHDSFIVAAGRDGLWIVDQHVAHERVLFERVLRDRAAGKVATQQLLLPMLIELTAGQQLEFARIAGELEAAGFECEPFGNRTLAIKAAPAAAAAAELEDVVRDILETAESELRDCSMDDIRRAVAASIACRAAIKANTRLDFARMEWLLQALAATDYPMSCPHGRPVALHYSTREILKSFHRL